MQRRTGVAAIAAGAALAALPAAAAASTTVYAGPPPALHKLLPKSLATKVNPDVNDFFQHRVTIHVGSTVTFKNEGFHTIDLPGKTGQDLPLLVPGATVTGVNDAAGNPFWFNGKVPSIGLNSALLSGSKATRYNGSARIDSGLPSGPSKPLKVTFTRAGTYKYFCDVHPGMVGFVVVKPKDKDIPTAKQNQAALAKQLKRDLKEIKHLAGSKPPADTVSLGESGANGVELFTMFPNQLTVNAGTTVKFTLSADSREVHTATFAPKAALKTLVAGFNSPVFPAAGVYPSDPVQPLTLTPTSHGNGFTNTGALDEDSATAKIGPSSQITFATPGTYRYICLIHPFMHGEIVVK